MTKAKVAVLFAFALAFAAGAAAGLLVGRPAPRQRSMLSSELNLTPAQRDEMRKIWSDATGTSRRDYFERKAAIEKERDEAIRNLLSDDKTAAYEAVLQECSGKLAKLSEERRKQYQLAVERTKAILTETQRKKYEEILKRRAERSSASHSGRNGAEKPDGSGASEHQEQPPASPGPR